MKPRCLHQWKFSHKEPHGEDRVIHHFTCRLCPKTRTRNIKKPRPAAYSETSAKKLPRVPKLRKTLQSGLKRKSGGIKAVSDKRKKQNAEYSVLKAEFLMQNLYCEVFPALIATEVHHGMGREGKWLLDTTHWHAVSRAGHEWIENNRAEAAKRGFLKLRLTTDQLCQQSVNK